MKTIRSAAALVLLLALLLSMGGCAWMFLPGGEEVDGPATPAATDEPEISEEEKAQRYKNGCIAVEYKTLARRPDSYVDKDLYFHRFAPSSGRTAKSKSHPSKRVARASPPVARQKKGRPLSTRFQSGARRLKPLDDAPIPSQLRALKRPESGPAAPRTESPRAGVRWAFFE